ncbi:MAG TPA: N-6 DNA methylase [Sphingomicrobium sp.]|nr:N-6 DNA methylase [Sphingomicrobium sp.]
MIPVDLFAQAAEATGYRREALVRDYAFADVLAVEGGTRKVPFAAFTQTPPSYRSAALAVVEQGPESDVETVQAYRSLGAPLLFVVSGEDVSVWQVRAGGAPRRLEQVGLAGVPALFERNRADWQPDVIHRAKSIGSIDRAYQRDFVDLGLLPAVEGEIHVKLDQLLIDTMQAAHQVAGHALSDPRLLFRIVFRLLAAKVLQDRQHAYSASWNPADLVTVLRAIESYYSLPAVLAGRSATEIAPYAAAWAVLRQGISFSNISSEDLAFVYENTFVTPETRRQLGTHSTPRQLAEYAVSRLELHRFAPETLTIYEPFAGAGVFLVSALRHLRDLLPGQWSDRERHQFLVQRLAGDEYDPFACEVATLSLILADYPNQNGWHIRERDLFADDVLAERFRGQAVILCNPPFEAFNQADRDAYALARRSYSKPVAVLDAALSARPRALAFVLPRPFIQDRQFAEQRRQVEALYGSVELVELPDRIFGAAVIESALLIARDLRPAGADTITLLSTEVADRDRLAFLKTGKVTVQRALERPVSDPTQGELWIPPLHTLWAHLSHNPALGEQLEVHRGIEWNYAQDQASSCEEQPGYRRGFATARNLKQYLLPQPVWLDCRSDTLRGNAIDHPWGKPKLMANAGRLSRGPWRIAATPDSCGLIGSQQWFGMWPRGQASDCDLAALAAIVNGPVANAYLAVHSPAKGIRISAVSAIPMPVALPDVSELVTEYRLLLAGGELMSDRDGRLRELLIEIDARVLAAYDLPPRLERDLLDYFGAAERPVAHDWSNWNQLYPAPGLTLTERLSGRFRPRSNWVRKLFKPLPANEAELLRTYGV